MRMRAGRSGPHIGHLGSWFLRGGLWPNAPSDGLAGSCVPQLAGYLFEAMSLGRGASTISVLIQALKL